MEQKNSHELLKEYFNMAIRGKYFILVPLAICFFVGTAIAFKLPKIYRAEAKMFYMQPQIPDWAQLETINMYLEAMLIFVEAIALRPDNVTKLIKELDLYPELEGRVPTSKIVENFKTHYNMNYDYAAVPSKYGRTEEVITGFEFSFEHTDARKAYYVTNALATNFVEIYRQFREATSSRSSTFFEAERERLRREMSAIDQKIANFKLKHVKELPELFQLNYRMVEMINDKLFQVEQKIMQLRGQQGNLEAMITTMSPNLGMTGLSGERIVSPQERLFALQSELGQLRARYSDRHPDIIRAQHEIAKLETLVKEQGNSPENANNDERSVFLKSGGALNPEYARFSIQLDDIKEEIKNLQAEKASYEADLEEYERRVGITPFVEKEWLLLARDRESAQNRFNELASQVLTMESSAEMEKRELGGRLSIGQPPTIPLAPYKPNIPLIIALSCFVGLCAGIGLLLGWDYMTKTVRTQHDLQAILGTDVLVELPMLTNEATGGRFTFNRTYLRLAVVLLIIAVVLAVDLFYMKVDVLLVKIFSAVQEKLALTGL